MGACLIVLAGLVVYANSFQGVFVFDDLAAIQENPTIRSLWPLHRVLFPAPHPILEGNTVQGRPLLNLTFALNYAAGGLKLWGYHAGNLAIHLLAALALFGIVRRTLLLPAHREKMENGAEWLALAVALLWAVHPLQTESVTYLAQRAESLVGLLYLLTVYLAIRGFNSARPWGWYAASAAVCALGMTAKELMATAPVLVLLYDWTFVAGSLRTGWRARRGFYAALFASWAVFAAVLVGTGGSSLANVVALFSQLGGGAVSSDSEHNIPWHEYALTQFGAIVHYLRLSLWPHPLVLDYGYAVANSFWEVALPAIVVAGLLAGTVMALRRRHWAGFLGAWFFLILAPTTSVIPLSRQTMAEHRMYLSLAAVVVLVVLGGNAAWRKWAAHRRNGRAIAAASAAAVLAALSWRTIARNRDYRSDLSIWRETVAHCPTNFRAQHNLGMVMHRLGRGAEAGAQFRKALELSPTYAVGHGSLGNLLMESGNLDEAIAHFRKAVEIRPDFEGGWFNLGNAMVKAGQFDSALAAYRRAVEVWPDFAEAHNNLGLLLLQTGHTGEAIVHYRRVVAILPEKVAGYGNLGFALSEIGRFEEAVASYRKALALNPRELAVLSNFAWLLATCGEASIRDGPRAVEMAEEANRIAGESNAQVLRSLAAALAEAGRFPEAVATGQRASYFATTAGNTPLAESVRLEIDLYRKGVAYGGRRSR